MRWERKRITSSQDVWWGWHTIKSPDENGVEIAYMTRVWIGRLRLHIFHRGDRDQDCHDHPWDFITFPLTSYVEEVLKEHKVEANPNGKSAPTFFRTVQITKRFRFHYRPAEHAHRVLGAWSGHRFYAGGIVRADGTTAKSFLSDSPTVTPGKKIVTLVWATKVRRPWGFWKSTAHRWCWEPWRKYVFEGGRNAPCG